MKYHIVKPNSIFTLCGEWLEFGKPHSKPISGLCKKCIKAMEKQESITAHKGDEDG